MRFRSHEPPMAEGDLTPMIDMAFQLIAFFMVLINFTQSGSERDGSSCRPASWPSRPMPRSSIRSSSS